jgi:hypothetical protein
MTYTLTITRDGGRSALRSLKSRLTPEALQRVIGPACLELTRRHLLALGPNKKGWPTTHFYGRAARAANLQQTPDGSVIEIPLRGFRQRYWGGPIRPVNKRALTIPVAAEAYGKVAGDFPGLVAVRTGQGAFLARGGSAAASQRAQATPQLLFALRGAVNQRGDKSILPTDDEYFEVIETALNKQLGGGK